MGKNKKSSVKLTPEEKYWNQIDQQTHYLIADILNQSLPLPNLRDRKNFDLEKNVSQIDRLSSLSEHGNTNRQLEGPRILCVFHGLDARVTAARALAGKAKEETTWRS